MKKYTTYIIAAIGLMTIGACKKKTTPAPDPVASSRISDVTSYASGGYLESTTRIIYNTDNTVDSMIQTMYTTTNPSTTFRKYTYSAGYYEITFCYPGNTIPSSSVAKVMVNSAGMITSVENSNGTRTMTYDNKNHLVSYTEGHAAAYTDHGTYIPPSSTAYSYKWNNSGNIDSFANADWGFYTPYYVNDMSHKGQTGDMVRIEQFLNYGRTYTNTSNVPFANYNSGVYPNPVVPWYHYDYDDLGRITKAYFVGDSTNFRTYKYY